LPKIHRISATASPLVGSRLTDEPIIGVPIDGARASAFDQSVLGERLPEAVRWPCYPQSIIDF